MLYISSFAFNLIYISKLVSTTPYQITFTDNVCFIHDAITKMKIGSVDVRGGLYQLIPHHFKSHFIHSTINHPKCDVIPIDLWHFHLGHLSNTRLHTMQQLYPCLTINKDFTCNTCHYAKQRKLSFSSSHSTASRPFSLLHMDIWGPYSISSIHGHRFFLTIVDDNTRFTWIFLMINKSETRMHIVNFINLIETQFNTRVQTIRANNGVEFLMQNFFNSKGIVHQTTCIETPQQNGVVSTNINIR